MKNRPLLFFIISLCVLALDQYTKYLIKSHLALFEVIAVLPFFNIVYVQNTGSAFGMFKSLGSAFFIISSIAAIVLISVLAIKDGGNRVALALILGGAMGNLMDRIFNGYVIDFLDVYVGRHHWPAFNVADSALTVGISLFIFTSLLQPRKA